MNTTTDMIQVISDVALLVAALAAFLGLVLIAVGAPTNNLYRVSVPIGNPPLVFSNVVSVTECSAYCKGVNYIKDGSTNTFHAFGVPIKIEVQK